MLLSRQAMCRLQVPQDLQQEMLNQQAACDTIIASKDAIVAAMRAQLHQKDDEYVRMLKQQGEDVDLLLLNMGKQLEEMQTAYRDELAQIDDAYMQVHTPPCYSLTVYITSQQKPHHPALTSLIPQVTSTLGKQPTNKILAGCKMPS